MFSLHPFLIALLAPTLALSLSQNRTSKIQWGPCNTTEVGNITAPLTADCANLPVPLDYTSPLSNTTLTLQLARIPASTHPFLGSILLNFGGPGGTGRDSLLALAGILRRVSGGQYDLIAFDPRGTGNTIPFTCFQTELEAYAFSSEFTLGNVSDVAYGRLWAEGEITAALCAERQNVTGEYVGTAFVARDLISVVDALGEDGMLRYWGFSYGTTLGATVAAMFPDRIDKMILDGVQNPHEYYHSPVDYEEWTYSDLVFSGIFSTCLSAPSNCALASLNKTAPELEVAVYSLLETIKYRPLALGTALLDYNTVKSYIVSSLYDTATWPTLATLLTLLLTGDVSALVNNLQADVLGAATESPMLRSAQTATSLLGIHCSDRSIRTSTLDGFLPAIQRLERTSRLMGDVTTAVSMTCTQWLLSAKERYTGDFRVKTRNPVLIVGNTFDGLTPITSARNVSDGLEGSVLLEVDGYGHSSLPLPSACTLHHVSSYWKDGSLPAPGTVCEVDAMPYSNVTWADVFSKAGGNGTAFAKRGLGGGGAASLGKVARMW